MDDLVRFGRNMKALREAEGISIRRYTWELLNRVSLNISWDSIECIERGARRAVGYRTLYKLSCYWGYTVVDMLTSDKEEELRRNPHPRREGEKW